MQRYLFPLLSLGILYACQPKDKASPPQAQSVRERMVETADPPPLREVPELPPNPSPPSPPMEMRLRIPLQYWMLERRGMNLSFNSPWDGDPSASILEDPRDPSIQAFTHACAERAERELRALLVREDIQRTWEEIASLGGSQQLLIVVNQAPSGTQLRDLQALDRAPEMWFWNQDDKRPQLAFALWNRGSFVYEVAASPENCWMVPEENLTDLLQYAAKRLSRRKAS